jgi:fatty-acyl-CoA synthase
VFEPGDAWFRSGDLLRFDAEGYFYFVDRIGDTFRWKGENVSTQEVAETLCAFPGVELCAVYGVRVPGADGRAGMAALSLGGAELDGAALYRFVTDALPPYAAPALVRLKDRLEVTGTLKLRKLELQREGFDAARVFDPLYVRDDGRRSYVPLDAERRRALEAGELRL